MKKLLTVSVFAVCLAHSLQADALKNSLTNIMSENDSTGMVNLNGININGKRKVAPRKKIAKKTRPGSAIIGHYEANKPVYKKEADKYVKKVTKGKITDIDFLPREQRLLILKDLQSMYKAKHFKSRKATAVIATVNGENIYKKDADNYLKEVTAGKVKDFDRLDKKQRLVLVNDLAKPLVVNQNIDENVTEMEKDEIFKQIWLEKQRKTIEVSSDEMLTLYEYKKKQTLLNNPQAVIPQYMSIGENLKSEIVENKIMNAVTKDINITVFYDENSSIENKIKKEIK
ncbi:MAG: hypothetical protein U9N11_00270 [Campylobacterota bacterium]|nr:hypothetical protein [Campylobacterota bacterium]